MIDVEDVYAVLIMLALLFNGLAVAGAAPLGRLLAPLRERRLLLGAVALDLAVVPVALLVPAVLLGLGDERIAGLVLLAGASAGPIGVALARIGRGDLALTVSLVTALGVANLVTMPLLMAVLLPGALHVPILEVGRSLLLLLVLPLLAGVALRRTLRRRRLHPEAMARIIRRLGGAATLCLGGTVLTGLLIDPVGIARTLVGAPLVPAVAMLIAVGLAVRVLSDDGPRRRALWLATTARSVGVALAVAAIHLPAAADTRATVLAVGGLTQAVPVLTLLGRDRWAGRAGRGPGRGGRRGRLPASEGGA